jgi:MoCo/4Fe-4S cofactor protein with predicted Tat translocation signal
MSEEPRKDSGLGVGDSHGRADSGATDPSQSLIPNPQSLGRAEFWRSLEEQAGDPAFQELLYNEFPSQIEAMTIQSSGRRS